MAGNNLMSMISLVQSHDHEGSPMGKEVAEVKVGRIVMADDEARCGLLEPYASGGVLQQWQDRAYSELKVWSIDNMGI